MFYSIRVLVRCISTTSGAKAMKQGYNIAATCPPVCAAVKLPSLAQVREIKLAESSDTTVFCVGLCYENDVRLVGGSSTTEGIVEVCLTGQWGTVCANSWEPVDAKVVCRQLGFLTISEI